MNIHNILYLNIMSSPYFKSLYEKKTYHEVIDEIYYNVKSLEPFFKGTNATSAFCLLYKLFTLKLTEKQLEGLLEHPDSPHIRAIGFLYLRYAGQPSDIWSWFEPYLDDEEELPVRAGPNPKTMTIGSFCRAILTEQKWFETMLPRIPIPIARDIEKKLRERGGGESITGDRPASSVELQRSESDATIRASSRRRDLSPPRHSRHSRESSRASDMSRRFDRDRRRYSRSRSPAPRDRYSSHEHRRHSHGRSRSRSPPPRSRSPPPRSRSRQENPSSSLSSSHDKQSQKRDAASSEATQSKLAALKERYGDASASSKQK
ncbi:hypothetical protein BASA50_003724 [Batrachochytrium salamandrivorans]|uniref:Pre-mRNA-splicing factor 38 n=1 Tax=Batrachochytrium salamandrivorans TaxID=1357716 RepID=A0ABQ8FJH9_9FUNG|nr:hypothetical protein BASA50_003724 [Batrachochytrium salamandrivorans]